MLIDPVFAGALQSGTAVVVLLSALAKWRRPAAFRDALAAWHLLPVVLAGPAAIAITATETLGAFALLLREMRAAGATLLIALFALFAAGLAINILRGHTNIDCGCSGLTGLAGDAGGSGGSDQGAPRGIGWWHVARAVLFAGLVSTAYIQPVARNVVWLDYFTLFFAALFVVCALLTLDALIVNGPRLHQLRNS